MAIPKEKRIFIISNTTHFLSVKTYIQTHTSAQNNLILVLRPFKGHRRFIHDLKKDEDVKLLKVFLVKENKPFPFSYFKILRTVFEVRKLSHSLPTVDKIFFTGYWSWLQHYMVKKFSAKKTVLISDGTGIFSVAEVRNKNKRMPYKRNRAISTKMKFLVEKLLRIPPIIHLHYYSPVDIEVPEGDSVELFQYSSSGRSGIDKKKVFFVGSPLVELGHLDIDKHMSVLKRVKEKFPDSQIFYFAHRREKEENLLKYDFLGEMIRDTIPFEERMEKQDELPGSIISYVSSVLINLPNVYPDVEFWYLFLDQNDFSDETGYKERYLRLEENFQKIQAPNFGPFK